MNSFLANPMLTLFAQEDVELGAGMQGVDTTALMGTLACVGVLVSVVVVILIASMWKIFVKAGKPGWACIVPIYNQYVLTEIAGKEILWFVLLIIPCTAPIAAIVICIDIAKNFGKDTLYGLGLAFLPFIFFPLLGFGNAQYRPVPKA